jgi:hypothetical protein
VGVTFISHKISDFDSAMRSSMNISVGFRTKYEGDLGSIARTLGGEIAKIVPSMPVGYSISHSADLGPPFATTWRPLYSQPQSENRIIQRVMTSQWLRDSSYFDVDPLDLRIVWAKAGD